MFRTQSRYLVRSILANHCEKEQPKSILNDDMLARAGFEDVDPKEETSNSEEQATKQTGRKRKRAQTSKDLQRERYANMFYLSALIFGVAGVGYMSRDWDSEKEQEEMDGKNVENGYTPKLII
ncbi:Mitochondrial import inner membrane translocase subunit TIM50 domain protein [Candida albicans]|uniref:Mitochondrial import inner membrane translocase subunit TIM50 domain protein n=1 Tax=Candida albicans TaxID=5476 RepID=A0A8H6F0S7_CANAX|nr:Mitochondrial import inner membrane translocase subunit TIM50 domain protein [Candida albicans]